MKKRICYILLILCMVMLLPCVVLADGGSDEAGANVFTDTLFTNKTGVKYLDENGVTQTCNDYTIVTSDTTEWGTGWYVVREDVAIDHQVQVTGDAKLILCDDATLTVTVTTSLYDLEGLRISKRIA